MNGFADKKREPVFEDNDGHEAPTFEVVESEKDDDDDEIIEDERDDDDKPKRKDKDKDEDDDVVDEREEELAAARNETANAKGYAAKERFDRVSGEHSQAEYLNKVIESQIKETRTSLAKARSEDETEQVVALETKMDELKDAKTKTEKVVEDYTNQVSELKKVGADRGAPIGGGAEAAPGQAMNAKAKKWQKANKWMLDSNAKTKVVLGIAEDLDKEGKDPSTDAYFRELSKRISKEFPNLGVKYGDGKPVVKSKRTPGGSGRRGAVDSGKTSGTDINAGGKSRRLPRLEASDKAKMQKFGLDPDDKNAVKHWLRSKKEAADQEARESESY